MASIVFREPVGLVDGNVVRVMSRLRAIGSDTKNDKVVKVVVATPIIRFIGFTIVLQLLWKLADGLVDPGQPGDFNQALMEFGATVCTPTSPGCSKCILKTQCIAYQGTFLDKQAVTGFDVTFEHTWHDSLLQRRRGQVPALCMPLTGCHIRCIHLHYAF